MRRLLKLLDPTHTRVALVAFGDKGELVAPITATRPELEKALATLDHKHGWYGGTNYAAALETATSALQTRPRTRRSSASAASCSCPTATRPCRSPSPSRPSRRSRRPSARAAQGDHLHSFALGPEAVRGRDILSLMSKLADGTLTEIERPGDVLFHLPSVELSEIAEVKLENATTKQPGRAVRVLADGTFDGFVPLEPGRNQIQVTAIGIGGGRLEETRTVFYEPAPGMSEQVADRGVAAARAAAAAHHRGRARARDPEGPRGAARAAEGAAHRRREGPKPADPGASHAARARRCRSTGLRNRRGGLLRGRLLF